MSFPQGIYFRQLDDQTDPTNYDAEVGGVFSANYPRTSAQGNNVGWEQQHSGSRDRGGSGAVELRGIHFRTGTPVVDYRIDLPATGTYNVRSAFGDEASGQTGIKAEFLDTTTVFATPLDTAGTVNAANYVDASGVTRTSQADWSANNAAIQRTFASTIFRSRLGRASGGNTPVAAVYIEAAAAAGDAVPQAWAQYRRRRI